MLQLFIDHDFNHKILRGLMRRIPKLDFVTAEQIGRKTASDQSHLVWALENERVVITHDTNTFTKFAYQRLKNGEDIFGVLAVPQDMPIGDVINELEIIILCSDKNEFVNRVRFLPFGLT